MGKPRSDRAHTRLPVCCVTARILWTDHIISLFFCVLSTMGKILFSVLWVYLEDSFTLSCAQDGAQTHIHTVCTLQMQALCLGKDAGYRQKGQTSGRHCRARKAGAELGSSTVKGKCQDSPQTIAEIVFRWLSLNLLQNQGEAEGCRVGQGDGATWQSPVDEKASSAVDRSSAGLLLVYVCPGESLVVLASSLLCSAVASSRGCSECQALSSFITSLITQKQGRGKRASTSFVYRG